MKWGITSTDDCHLCGNSKETVEHLFYECSNAKKCIKKVVEYVNTELSLLEPIRLDQITLEHVLFCNFQNDPRHLINFLFLVMKQYIYSCKCTNKSCNSIAHAIEINRKRELYNAKKSGNTRYFYRKWKGVKKVINSFDYMSTEDLAQEYICEMIMNDILKL